MKKFALLLLCNTYLYAFAQQKSAVIQTSGTALLIPEGIAVDALTGKIYVSSINEHKIIVIDTNGNHSDFIKPDQDAFLEGLGMKIDQRRGWLWVTSNRQQGKQYTSQVHAFGLKTGMLHQHYKIIDTIPHLFNDLVIDKKGKILLTDTYYSALYSIDPEKEKLELAVKSSLLDYPNGLTFGPNGRLYIATYRNGLMMLNPDTKKLSPLNGYKDSTAFGLDGLVWWNNTLIGIYNLGTDRSLNSVIQYTLDKAGTSITGEQFIDRGHPLFYEPTTSSLVGNKLYVLANSHLATYNANKESVKGAEHQLKPVTVICYTLE